MTAPESNDVHSHSRRRCAIVGAGQGGLACARWALAYDIEPVVFEKDGNVGGLWRYTSNPDEPSVMRSTVLNTSKEMTAYSDFPPPADSAPFMRGSEFYRYLSAYAEHHQLCQWIRFGHRVLNIRRGGRYSIDGRWMVEFVKSSGGRDEVHEELFELVLVAEGHHRKPNMPAERDSWPGMAEFRGRVLHSSAYKDPISQPGFTDGSNVVVGVGNSGVDIATELSHYCDEPVQLSTRRGAWVIKRTVAGGWPIDMRVNTRFVRQWLARVAPLRWMAEALAARAARAHFDHSLCAPLKPTHAFSAQAPTLNDELPSRVLCGSVVVRPDIRRFTAHGVVWADGRVTERVDRVIMATGYCYDFSLVEHGELLPTVKDNWSQLYLRMFPLELIDNASDSAVRGHQFASLAFIGLLQAAGGGPPVVELQARLFFHYASGSTKERTPVTKAQALEAIRREEAAIVARYFPSKRHTLQVDYIAYMDKLVGMIGCAPQPWRWLLRDPRLCYRLIFGPNASYVYRLRGPHAWEGARSAIMAVEENTRRGFNG